MVRPCRPCRTDFHHLLVHKRAEPLVFPTLRFVLPTRLAAIRRQFLDDVPLLLVRAAILGAATAAMAAPFVMTTSRRTAWNARVVRAIVIDGESARPLAQQEVDTAFRATVIKAQTISDGVKRAVTWMGNAPPAKLEIVVVSAFPIGSLNASDVIAIPAGVGVRFVRVGSLPRTASSDARSTLGAASNPVRARLHLRSVMLDAGATRVAEKDGDETTLPVNVDASQADRPAVDAALAAVLAEGVFAPAPNHAARLVVVGAPGYADALASAQAMSQRWMADGAAAIARDAEFAAAARVATAHLADSRFTQAPWQPLGDDPRPFAAAAASGDRLLIVSAAAARDFATPLLLRATLNSLAPRPSPFQVEVLAIPDATLGNWQRPPGDVMAPDNRRLDEDDRRWLWAAALALLAVEGWMSRARSASRDLARVA